MLAIRNLNVHYGGIHALRGIDIDVPDGKIISLIGEDYSDYKERLYLILSYEMNSKKSSFI